MSELTPRVRHYLEALQKAINEGRSAENKHAELVAIFPESKADLDAALREIERMREMIFEVGPRIADRLIEQHKRRWYTGPNQHDKYWPLYERHLLEERGWSDNVVQSIDEASTQILSNCGDPSRTQFDVRGLVIGHVQSGKTANFTGVIAKAADRNYRLVIVLSGITNSLRQQTQERIEADLVQYSPDNWQTWTTVENDVGVLPISVGAMLNSPGQRNLVVAKKNAYCLECLLEMLRKAGRSTLAGVPVLIIDDECDQAGVNSSRKEDEPTKINGQLRELLALLPRKTYIGYTATPYANVLIHPGYPEDLYPRDFIISLPTPKGYFGSERLFGRDLIDAESEDGMIEGLNVIRNVDDEELDQLIPDRSTREEFNLEVTESLREAILYYWAATAAREFRNDHGHSCMLIHTTPYVAPQLNARKVVEKFCTDIQNELDGKNRQNRLDDFERIWQREMDAVDSLALGRHPVDFNNLLPFLDQVVRRTSVAVENSESDERLDLSGEGKRIIVIGGNVLARGLTIDGLLVSFFVRRSGQYDSLMQMGRWFGYRGGYEDLPRVWMGEQLQSFFRDISTTDAEIRQQIKLYGETDATPLSLALRIRTHPELKVTSAARMASAVTANVSFGGNVIQTRRFLHRDRDWLTDNWNAGARLLEGAVEAAAEQERHVLRSLPVDVVREFFRSYRVHESHPMLQSHLILGYIDRRGTDLARWNVAVITGDGKSDQRVNLGPFTNLIPIVRSRLKVGPSDNVADIKALMSRQDLVVDLPAASSTQPSSRVDALRLRKSVLPNDPPLLLLYPIDAFSAPVRNSSEREPLDAVAPVLGIGLYIPAVSADEKVLEHDYVQADLRSLGVVNEPGDGYVD